MYQLPPSIAALLVPFAPLFSRRVWAHAQVLLAGALLAPARRTVTAALRAMGAGIIGVGVVGMSDLSFQARHFSGDFLALLAGFLFSIHCLLGRTLRQDVPNLVLMPYIFATGAIVALIACLASGAPLSDFDRSTVTGFVSLALFPTILGHASLVFALRRFKVSTVSVLVLLEPVLAGMGALLAYNEPLSGIAFVGYALIVAGLIPWLLQPRSRQCAE